MALRLIAKALAKAGDLHEYGGLGRVVTKSEALAAI